jgi:hypothetical protein
MASFFAWLMLSLLLLSLMLLPPQLPRVMTSKAPPCMWRMMDDFFSIGQLQARQTDRQTGRQTKPNSQIGNHTLETFIIPSDRRHTNYPFHFPDPCVLLLPRTTI